MVSTGPLISKSYRPCTNSFVTLPNLTIKIGIRVTFMSIVMSVLFQGLGSYLSFHLFSLLPVVSRVAKSTIRQVLFYVLTIIRSRHLAEIKRLFSFSKSQRVLYVSFSRMDCGLCLYHLFV